MHLSKFLACNKCLENIFFFIFLIFYINSIKTENNNDNDFSSNNFPLLSKTRFKFGNGMVYGLEYLGANGHQFLN